MLVLFNIPAVIGVLIVVCLWKFSSAIASLIVGKKQNDDQTVAINVDGEDLLSMGLVLMGVWILINVVVEFISLGYLVSMHHSENSELQNPVSSMLTKTTISLVVRFVLGLILVMRFRGVMVLLARLRTLGLKDDEGED